MLDASGEHFLSFEEAQSQETSESDHPTLKAKISERSGEKTNTSSTSKKSKSTDLQTGLLIEEHHRGLQGDASLYTAQNARTSVNCIECQKPRVVYSKSKVTERQTTQCALMMSEYDYTCGAPICPHQTIHWWERCLLVLQLHASLLLNTHTMGQILEERMSVACVVEKRQPWIRSLTKIIRPFSQSGLCARRLDQHTLSTAL